jgi:predicted MFS family arabinose efflux permease
LTHLQHLDVSETVEHAEPATAVGARWYVLALLTAIYTIYAMDRNLVSIVLEPVKREFGLSDTAAGLLAGTAYAISFGLAGIPLGLLVDRANRRNLLTAAIALWSGVTALSGIATSYAALLAARVGLAIFEAPGLPASTSILADLFDRHKRATAFGIYTMGLGFGSLLGYAIGGIVAGGWGWRAVFFVGSAPGLILAFLFWTTTREPARRSSAGHIERRKNAPPVGETFKFMASQHSLLLLYGAHITLSLTSSALLAFLPSFYIRSHGLSIHDVGLIIGFGFGTATIIGSAAGGVVADRLSRRDILWIPRFGACAAVVVLLSSAATVIVPSTTLTVLFVMVWGATFLAQVGPNLGLNQSLVGTRMRGTAAATLNTLVNIIAQGLGATLTGFLSDRYAPWAGSESLRYALFTVCLMNIVPIMLYLRLTRGLKRDVARAEIA